MNDSDIVFSSYTAAMNARKLLLAAGIRSSAGKTSVPAQGCMYTLRTENSKYAAEILKRNNIRFSFQDQRSLNENERTYN